MLPPKTTTTTTSPKPLTMTNGAPADAEMTLTTELLEQLLSDYLAREGKMTLPVYREVEWWWSVQHQGPVCRVRVRQLGNVVRLQDAKKVQVTK